MFKELYQYRELLKTSVSKEIRGKYKGSFLGVLWSFVNPLLQTIIYSIVFSILLRSDMEHYTTFIVIGVLSWTWFTTSISGGTNCIVINGGIIKKVYFPREILPISIVTSGMINYLISCLIIFIFLLCTGIGFSWNILFLPLIMVVQYTLQLGILLTTCSINAYIRDAEYIINFFVNMAFYATPILYASTMFGKFSNILKLNPMTTIIDSYRNIFYYQTMPNFYALLIVFLVSLLLLIIGYSVFKKLEKGFAEEL